MAKRLCRLNVIGLLVLSVLAAYTPSTTAAPDVPAQYQELHEKAEREGTVRVIVGVKAGFRPEGQLGDPPAVQGQRKGIARAQEALLQRHAHHGIRAPKRFEYVPFLVLQVDAAALATLTNDPEVTSIKEDLPEYALLAESVPLIGGTAAWTAGYSGAGQTIAVLDTGVDINHPFLAGKVVAEACYSTNDPYYGLQSFCPSGSTAPGAGANCPSRIEGCEHGTHVAGIAAGKGASFSGVARDATLIAVQVFSSAASCSSTSPFPTACPVSLPSDQVSGLEHIYRLRSQYNIAAVNMSLGGRPDSSTSCDFREGARKAAIDNLRSAGIATVIASGNNGNASGIATPACISTAVSVGSTTKADTVSSFSQSAPILSLLAPGSNITSSVLGGGFQAFSGTSMAAPHVAGAWAVLKAKAPSASVDELLGVLQRTGVAISDNRNPFGAAVVKPRIQIDAALNALSAPPPPPPSVTLNPTSLAFGDQITGRSTAPRTVVLSNTGTGSLTISSITASDDFAQTTTCGTTLAAGATCNISITFTPTATGLRTGALTIVDDAPGSPHMVALSGNGVPQPVTPPSRIFLPVVGQRANLP